MFLVKFDTEAQGRNGHAEDARGRTWDIIMIETLGWRQRIVMCSHGKPRLPVPLLQGTYGQWRIERAYLKVWLSA